MICLFEGACKRAIEVRDNYGGFILVEINLIDGRTDFTTQLYSFQDCNLLV